jgi:exosortase family protein XrtM
MHDRTERTIAGPNLAKSAFADSRAILSFVVLFVGAFIALQVAYSSARDTEVERMIVDVATVRPSAAIIDAITPREQVRADGHRLVSPHARLSVLDGCEGTECMMLLIAAILAHRARLRDKLVAMLLGVGLVYAVNQLRIVALYYTFRFERDWFALLHGYIAPTFVVVVAAGFFLWWSRRAAAAAETTP